MCFRLLCAHIWNTKTYETGVLSYFLPTEFVRNIILQNKCLASYARAVHRNRYRVLAENVFYCQILTVFFKVNTF